MKRIYLGLVLAVAIPFLAFAQSTRSARLQDMRSKAVLVDGCTLVGGQRAPADLRIYDEVNGKKGRLLWSGTIQRDQRVGITTSVGRIRYDYKYGANDTWKEDVGAWCHNGEDTKLP